MTCFTPTKFIQSNKHQIFKTAAHTHRQSKSISQKISKYKFPPKPKNMSPRFARSRGTHAAHSSPVDCRDSSRHFPRAEARVLQAGEPDVRQAQAPRPSPPHPCPPRRTRSHLHRRIHVQPSPHRNLRHVQSTISTWNLLRSQHIHQVICVHHLMHIENIVAYTYFYIVPTQMKIF